MNLKGKVVIVTGASSGIGAATAKLFASHGALVTAVGRDEVRLKQVADICKTYHGIQPLCVRVDLTEDGSCEEVVNKTVETYKKIDVLVNCAGKTIVSSLFENSMDTFDDLVSLNLRVPYKLCQLCVPYLKLTKGNVVNVFGNKCVHRPGFLLSAILCSALQCFTVSGSRDLSCEGIRMNAVRPGLTRTHFLANFNVDEDLMDLTYNELANTQPQVINEPEDVAKMILFLAGYEHPNLTGNNLFLGGGATSC
ncbi:3-oxoacyl-[acyl-carrier-protein] reductase FabG [Papilio machaon]|uniref:3-oxoacyl-[acyl-carrier-protein] reductase FabG n=1 Tax=Papilio machaon TaxID=76193 RepID=A0A0N1IGB6_PAPMA|nr:3-oxoacyl-[acyl-carrier-protein] reductase FabG [Papilio machaon]